jgi:membrane protein
VLAAGPFLVASLIVNTWIFAAGKYLNLGAAPPLALVQITDWVVSFIAIKVLFAFIFKVLPRVPLHWGDVISAVAPSLLFTAGKVPLGVYLGKAAFTDTYGATGSLVVALVWVYYSAQVLFLGAEVTLRLNASTSERLPGCLAPVLLSTVSRDSRPWANVGCAVGSIDGKP